MSQRPFSLCCPNRAGLRKPQAVALIFSCSTELPAARQIVRASASDIADQVVRQQIEIGGRRFASAAAATAFRTRIAPAPIVRNNFARWSSGGPQIHEMSQNTRRCSFAVRLQCTSSIISRDAAVTTSRTDEPARANVRIAAALRSPAESIG